MLFDDKSCSLVSDGAAPCPLPLDGAGLMLAYNAKARNWE